MNAVDTLGQTALHRAALAGHIQTCKLLLSYGADPSIVSLQGFTAAQMGNEAIQQILNGKTICGFLSCGSEGQRERSSLSAVHFVESPNVFFTHFSSLASFFRPLRCLTFPCFPTENVPTRNSDVDYRFLEAAKAGDLDTVQVAPLLMLHSVINTKDDIKAFNLIVV